MTNAKSISIKDIPILNSTKCKIRDKDHVEKLLNNFIDGGMDKLQVVSDFDFTITKHKDENGLNVMSSFCILENCKSLPKSYLEKSSLLMNKYKPIELDPLMPISEKFTLMEEWWMKTSELLKGFPFDETEIEEVVSQLKEPLKDGTNDLFEELNNNNVPILVFSAGLGNSVISLMKHCKIMLPNVKVISNFLQYKDGVLDGLDEDHLIHVFNKNETALNGTEYYDLVHNRDHIILMGDSLGDAGMADGVPSSTHVLKIGFLFDHIEENLPQYMRTFDIVLVSDESMNVPKSIIKLINLNTKS